MVHAVRFPHPDVNRDSEMYLWAHQPRPLASSPLFVILFLIDDFRQHVRVGREALPHVVGSHDADEHTVIAYYRDSSDTVSTHALEHGR